MCVRTRALMASSDSTAHHSVCAPRAKHADISVMLVRSQPGSDFGTGEDSTRRALALWDSYMASLPCTDGIKELHITPCIGREPELRKSPRWQLRDLFLITCETDAFWRFAMLRETDPSVTSAGRAEK